ncbi:MULTISPECIES: hypothetical protein [Anaerotruncus]|nr:MULTISPECIES: hypothetical protein [Anaerotruncus]
MQGDLLGAVDHLGGKLVVLEVEDVLREGVGVVGGDFVDAELHLNSSDSF